MCTEHNASGCQKRCKTTSDNNQHTVETIGVPTFGAQSTFPMRKNRIKIECHLKMRQVAILFLISIYYFSFHDRLFINGWTPLPLWSPFILQHIFSIHIMRREIKQQDDYLTITCHVQFGHFTLSQVSLCAYFFNFNMPCIFLSFHSTLPISYFWSFHLLVRHKYF